MRVSASARQVLRPVERSKRLRRENFEVIDWKQLIQDDETAAENAGPSAIKTMVKCSERMELPRPWICSCTGPLIFPRWQLNAVGEFGQILQEVFGNTMKYG